MLDTQTGDTMSIDSLYQVIDELPVGNTVDAVRSRQVVQSANQQQWIMNTFDLSQPPMFHHLISFIERISSLQHPHICEIRAIEVSCNMLRVVARAAQRTITDHRLRQVRSSEETVLKWVFQIASALQYVLREAKPVFLNLGPLDCSCCLISDQDSVCLDLVEMWLRSGLDPTRTVELTKAVFWAPEYFQEGAETGSSGAVGEKGQIWALGIVAYETAMLKSPFVSEAPLTLMDKIMQEDPALSTEFSELFRELLSEKMLNKRPFARFSFAELLAEKSFAKISLKCCCKCNVSSSATSSPALRNRAEQNEFSQPESGEAVEVPFKESLQMAPAAPISTDTKYVCRIC